MAGVEISPGRPETLVVKFKYSTTTGTRGRGESPFAGFPTGK